MKLGPDHQKLDPAELEVAILNSKGFGGNNATAVVLSPARTLQMLEKRHGSEAIAASTTRREASEASAREYFQKADRGDYPPIYRFGEGMIADEEIEIDQQQVRIQGLANPIDLPVENPYADMS